MSWDTALLDNQIMLKVLFQNREGGGRLSPLLSHFLRPWEMERQEWSYLMPSMCNSLYYFQCLYIDGYGCWNFHWFYSTIQTTLFESKLVPSKQ